MQDALNLFQPQEYSVTSLSNEIKRVVEGNFGYVRVKGEISGLKIASSGHGYFNLKDSTSVLACTCWRNAMSKVSIKLEDGVQIVAIGKISTYGGQSKYQLNVEQIEMAGIGNLMLILQQRKEALTKEGLFVPEHKKPIPFLPKTIGVVTSATGAVIQDIIHRIRDRFPCKIIIWPVAVQGQSAAQEIANAIDGFNRQQNDLRPDVIIVARGGGSIEDLWAFNEEIVVRATFNSNIPIISAVGHETDFTLIDLASDIRAPTPTAAAEFAVPVLSELKNKLADYAIILTKRLTSYLSYRQHILSLYADTLNPVNFILQKEQRFDDISMRFAACPIKYMQIKNFCLNKYQVLNLKPSLLIANLQMKLNSSAETLKHRIVRLYEHKHGQIALNGSLLTSFDVEKVLKRGFAIIKQGTKVISHKSQLQESQKIQIQLQDGFFDTKII